MAYLLTSSNRIAYPTFEPNRLFISSLTRCATVDAAILLKNWFFVVLVRQLLVPRLGDRNFAFLAIAVLHEVLRDLGSLSRAGLSNDDDHLVVPDCAHKLAPFGKDRKFLPSA